MRFPAGTEIITEGSLGDSFYFVEDGQLEVTRRSADGKEVKLSVIGSGQGFAEMALLTCAAVRAAGRAGS